MLEDQEQTERQSKPQSGSCLHCHASIMPLYRSLGDGDATAGFEKSYGFSYKELNKMLHESGHAHPVTCVDCHSPETMELRVSRPGFVQGIRALAESGAPTPHLPSVERWREGARTVAYDPNADASRSEMRSYVCAQCHVEYYCASNMKLTFPWGNGLKAEELEQFWDETTFADGQQFFDYTHKESGAKILKAQHPEFELWSMGIHARSGVACADCHMPYMRAGAALMDQLDAIQMARSGGASTQDLAETLKLQRKAQWRLDFIAAENSMGFHAPQEAARILGEAVDYARQGQVSAMRWDKEMLSR